ncbi:VanW family protein, partial [Candidatus Uhrbacteria bacterium]|nr:VanW family protein [Candidatus Uhrbacteria bacterium]
MLRVNFLPQPNPHARWPLVLATIFICGTLGGILLFEADERTTAGRIYPGVIIGGVSVGGRTPDDAEQLLDERATDRLTQGFAFVAEGKTVNLGASFSATQDLDLTYDIIHYDTKDAIRRAMRMGRSSHIVDNIATRIRARARSTSLPTTITIDEERLLDALRVNFAETINPAHDATLVYTLAHNDTPASTMLVHGDPESLPAPAPKRILPRFTVTAESGGTTLTYRAGITALREDLQAFRSRPITLAKIPDTPRIRAAEVTRLLPKAEELLARLPKMLRWRIEDAEQSVSLTEDIVGPWITVDEGAGGSPTLALDGEKIKAYLAALAETINVEPREAKFSLIEGRVNEFQSSRVGRRVSRDATLANIVAALLSDNSPPSIDLVIDTLSPNTTTDVVNDYGIREIIGVGHSNFKGSPPNRRHNIRVGAEALHGILIAPDEEFSLLKTLGDIDGKHGYKPELVIKGNKTIPEFGGGLCQIGTTVFRAA